MSRCHTDVAFKNIIIRAFFVVFFFPGFGFPSPGAFPPGLLPPPKRKQKPWVCRGLTSSALTSSALKRALSPPQPFSSPPPSVGPPPPQPPPPSGMLEGGTRKAGYVKLDKLLLQVGTRFPRRAEPARGECLAAAGTQRCEIRNKKVNSSSRRLVATGAQSRGISR